MLYDNHNAVEISDFGQFKALSEIGMFQMLHGNGGGRDLAFTWTCSMPHQHAATKNAGKQYKWCMEEICFLKQADGSLTDEQYHDLPRIPVQQPNNCLFNKTRFVNTN